MYILTEPWDVPCGLVRACSSRCTCPIQSSRSRTCRIQLYGRTFVGFPFQLLFYLFLIYYLDYSMRVVAPLFHLLIFRFFCASDVFFWVTAHSSFDANSAQLRRWLIALEADITGKFRPGAAHPLSPALGPRAERPRHFRGVPTVAVGFLGHHQLRDPKKSKKIRPGPRSLFSESAAPGSV